MADKTFDTVGSFSGFHSETSSSQPDQNGLDADMDDTGFSAAQAVATVRDVHKQLQPLQAEADRLGKQVESFAEALDRLGSKIHEKSAADCTHVLPLIKEYETIAKKTVAQLRELRDPSGNPQQQSEWKGRLRNATKGDILGTTVEDLRWWEQEQQTWNLLGRVVQTKYPAKHNDPTQLQSGIVPRPRKNIEIHRYSSEQTLWLNFLAEDDAAWERHLVLEWLKSSTDELNPPVEYVIEGSGKGSLGGRKVGAKGWEASKGTIKGQKRLRSWPTALDPNSPGFDNFDLKTPKNSSLITQLDPDAVTRQGRELDPQDLAYEHGTWLGCWEMLRRGRSWSQVRAWCKERTDVWRAVAVGAEVQLPGIPGEKPNTNAHNWQSRSLWRQVCVAAAMDGGLDDYERAVYGLVSGYLPSVLKVSQSWNEYLFAHYNSYLHYQFDAYLYSKYPERQATLSVKSKVNLETTLLDGTSLLSGEGIMDKMRRTQLHKEELKDPPKMIQANLIAGTFSELIHHLGQSLVRSLAEDPSFNDDEQKSNLRLMYEELSDISQATWEDSTPKITMHDHNMLRLLTHIQLIFQALGSTAKNDSQLKTSENILVAFGDFLIKAGKQQLLSLYASKMSPTGRLKFLALKLPSVLDTTERHIQLRLLKHYNINLLEVLDAQLKLLVFRDLDARTSWEQNPKLQILQDGPSTSYGGVRLIKASFLTPVENGRPIDLIHGFEWLNMLNGNWKRTLSTGVVLYKHFIRRGDFSAGRQLALTVPFSHISLRKTPGILGYEIDLGQHGPLDPGETNGHAEESSDDLSDVEMQNGESAKGRRRDGSWLERDVLAKSAALFCDLEALFLALDAMENWAQLAAKVNVHGKDLAQSKIWRRQMKSAQSALDEAMAPILSSEWLQSSKEEGGFPSVSHNASHTDDSDPLDYTVTVAQSLTNIYLKRGEVEEDSGENLAIRDHFLPELLIAYVAALNFYAHSVSRDYLIESMELVAYVADETKGKHVVETLMRTKRMAEFVELVARVSREMVAANELSQKGNSKKKISQKMGLWSVGVTAA